MVKKIIFILYILVLVCMAAATIVEKSQGTDYAHAHYYGAWWFILIWAVLAALGAFYIIKRKVKCASTLALHLSFIIILLGALLTHVSAKRGMIHLRIGQPTDTYMAQDEEQGNSLIFIGLSNPLVAKLNFNLNNSVFSSPNSFSNSGEDISLILFIFITITHLAYSFFCYEFCFDW